MKYNLFGDPDTCIKVWNPVNQTLLGVYDNYHKTGRDLQLNPIQVYRQCASKKRLFVKKYNMELAFRLSARTTDTVITNRFTYQNTT